MASASLNGTIDDVPEEKKSGMVERIQNAAQNTYIKAKKLITTPINYIFGEEDSDAKTAFYAAVGTFFLGTGAYWLYTHASIPNQPGFFDQFKTKWLSREPTLMDQFNTELTKALEYRRQEKIAYDQRDNRRMIDSSLKAIESLKKADAIKDKAREAGDFVLVSKMNDLKLITLNKMTQY